MLAKVNRPALEIVEMSPLGATAVATLLPLPTKMFPLGNTLVAGTKPRLVEMSVDKRLAFFQAVPSYLK